MIGLQFEMVTTTAVVGDMILAKENTSALGIETKRDSRSC